MNKAAQRPELLQGSWALAEALRPKAGETFTLRSKTRDKSYEMLVTPEGYVVHQGEGCEGEIFNGPLGCWHSKTGRKLDMTTAMTNYESSAPPARVFTQEDIEVLKTTICRGSTDAELGLFVSTCKHTGLDPFMKQIHAVFRNTNVGTSQRPEWKKVMSIQVGIDGYRLIAERTGLTQGMDGPQWSDDGLNWLDFPMSAQPKFARCAVWRQGVERPFVAVCRWDAYAQDNSMWKKMGAEQLAKCSEALALRRAYPAEMANLPLAPDYIDDEEVQVERRSFVPSPDAIEGESSVQGDMDDEVPGAPDDEPEAEEEAAAVLTLDEAKAAIVADLEAFKKSGLNYLAVYKPLSKFMPDGTSGFNPDGVLDAKTANEALAEVRRLIAAAS